MAGRKKRQLLECLSYVWALTATDTFVLNIGEYSNSLMAHKPYIPFKIQHPGI